MSEILGIENREIWDSPESAARTGKDTAMKKDANTTPNPPSRAAAAGLWCPWRFGIIKGFDFLNSSILILLFQLVVVYGVILLPCRVNAGPLFPTQEWVHPGNCIPEFWPASLVPYSEVVPVNRPPLHRNEYEERVFGVSLSLVEKEGNSDTASNKSPDNLRYGFYDVLEQLGWGLFDGIIWLVVFCGTFWVGQKIIINRQINSLMTPKDPAQRPPDKDV